MSNIVLKNFVQIVKDFPLLPIPNLSIFCQRNQSIEYSTKYYLTWTGLRLGDMMRTPAKYDTWSYSLGRGEVFRPDSCCWNTLAFILENSWLFRNCHDSYVSRQ